jgi:class 3 adenylate cyclase
MKYSKYIVFTLLFFVQFHLHAAHNNNYGNPIVRFYHPNDYKGYSQNWHIAQDENGIMYFANGDGVLEYDGHEWIMHKVGNHMTPTSLLIDNNIIWVGAKNDFGFFTREKGKEFTFFSLKVFAPEWAQEFGFVTKIYKSGKWVYFGTANLVFAWNGSEMKVLRFNSPVSLLNANEFILLYEADWGLRLLTGTKILNILGGEQFKDMGVRELLHYDAERYLLVTRSEGMFVVSFDFSVIYSPRIIVEAEIKTDAYKRAASDVIYHSIQLSNGQIALSTMMGGTYLLNPDGSAAGLLNRTSRIPNDTHTFLFEDKDGSLWITLDNGIAKVLLSGNFTYYDERSGLFGSVIDINFFQSHLFAGTWQGLYFLPLNSENGNSVRFENFHSIKSQCWKSSVVDYDNKKTLWAATSDGLFVIDEDFNERLLSEGLYYSILQLENYPELVFAGHREGVDVFLLQPSPKLLVSLKTQGQQSRIVSIDQEKSGRVWLGAEYLGVYSVDVIENAGKFDFQLKRYEKELPFADYYYVYNYFDQTFFVSREGIFTYNSDSTQNNFGFTRILYHPRSTFQKDFYINIFYQSEITGEAWFQMGSQQRAFKYFGKFVHSKDETKGVFQPYKLFPSFEVYAMSSDSSGLVWLGCDDGIFILNDNKKFERQNSYNAIIRTIETGKRDVFFHGVMLNNENEIPEFVNNMNNIRFSYASGSLIDESKTVYRYKLEGFDNEWSLWSELNSKEYTNLSPGVYTFMVQARDIMDQTSEVALFHFVILKPWYTTWFAYILYFIVVVVAGLGINIYTNRRLIKAKQRLENIVEKRTHELQMQKKEVEIEKEKSDRLLLNILPVKVAEELKTFGYSKAEYFEFATVLFTDFAGFTKIAERETSQELIDKLERFFILFDEIVIRNKMEKIKTIGDSHMSVGGVPVVNNTHVFDAVMASIEMLDVMKKARVQQQWANDWHLRIGIHTGNVIAGIVGKRKFAFDIWGDTVNMSSRLQETGQKDRINISREVYDIISPYFECEARGLIAVKHKGPVEMFFVHRLKPEYSKNADGTKPNLEFRKTYWNL